MLLTELSLTYVLFIVRDCFALTLQSRNFGELRQSPDFIDKTLLIKEFLESEKSVVIAAPKGFGRTSSLDMMRSFFSVDINETYGETLFRNTKISGYDDFMKNEHRKYAVIYCSFKQNWPVVDYRSLVAAFRNILHHTFSMHTYLIRSRALTRIDKKQLTCYTGVKKYLKLKPKEIFFGLYLLTTFLKRHHNREVILIIDDYDSIMLDCLFTKVLDYKLVLGFHNAVIGAALQENSNINKTILMGTTCTCVETLAQLQNLQCFRFLENKRFRPFFGITENEMDLLLKKDYSKIASQKEDIRKWYGGYTSPDLETQVYNTRSALLFLNSGELMNYWADKRSLKTIRFLLIEPVMEKLLNDSINHKPIKVRHIGQMEWKHFKGLKSFNKHELWNEECGDHFLHLLMEKGFFTYATRYDKEKEKKFKVKIPNEEIAQVFQKIIKTFFQNPIELLDRLKEELRKVAFSDVKEENTMLSSVEAVNITSRLLDEEEKNWSIQEEQR